MSFAHELQVAVRAAREAGAVAAGLQGSCDRHDKADGSPVTSGDLAADAVIAHHLTAAFPEDAILSEEAPAPPPGNRRVWIIDPIDGTADYVAGKNSWCVQIALAVDGLPVLGVLAIPGVGVELAGLVGANPVCWWRDAQGERRIDVAQVSGGAATILVSQSQRNAEGRARIAERLPEFALLPGSSIGVKVWRILSGEGDGFVHVRNINSWDAAAPAAVLLAAGGHATTLAGDVIRCDRADTKVPGLLFSRRNDHATLASRLRGAGIGI